MGQVQSFHQLKFDDISQHASSTVEIAREHKWRVIVGLTVAGAIWYWLKTPRNLPPGPKGLPFVGAMHQLSENIHFDFERLGKVYGDVFSLRLGTNYMIVLNSHRAIKEAFIKTQDFSNRPQESGTTEILNLQDGIFSVPYGNKFRENKKFATQALKQFGFGTAAGEKRIKQEVNVLLEYIVKENGEAIDLAKPLACTALNVISSIIFNQSSSWEEPEMEDFMNHILVLNDAIADSGIALFLAGGLFPRWMTRIVFRGIIRRMQALLNSFRNFIRKKINEHRETFDPNSLRDFVDVYIKDKANDPDFSESELIDTTMLFLPDSVHTLSIIMNWFFLYIGHHQDIQAAIQKEIDDICSSRPPSLADRPKLNLLEATIIETMRVSNVICTTGEHCSDKDQVLDGYHIPKSAHLMANLYAIHMDPELFPNPELFKPERHLDENGNLLKQIFVIPFSVGRRMCMGEALARMEIFLTTATLLQQFHFTFPEDQPNPSLEPNGVFFKRPHPYKIKALPR